MANFGIEGFESYQDNGKNKIVLYYKRNGYYNRIESFVFYLSKDSNFDMNADSIVGKPLINWIFNNQNFLEIQSETKDKIVKYLKIKIDGVQENKDEKLEEFYAGNVGIEYDKENNRYLAYYKTHKSLKALVIPKEKLEERAIGTTDELMNIRDKVIIDIKYKQEDKKIIVYYREENKPIQAVVFSISKPLNKNQIKIIEKFIADVKVYDKKLYEFLVSDNFDYYGIQLRESQLEQQKDRNKNIDMFFTVYDKRFDYENILEKEYTEKEKVNINLNNPINDIRFEKTDGAYEPLFAIQIPVIRGKDGKIITDKEGNNIKLKLNVVYTKDSGISYHFIGQSKQIVEDLKKAGKLSDDLKELKPLADLLFIDRYCTDKNLEKEIKKGKLLSKEHIAELSKLSEDVKQEEYKNYYGFEKQLIGLGYTFAEMEELLADIPGRTNTYVGVKDVEVNVTKQLLKDSEIAREIQRLKRAGIYKVVLLKDKDVLNKELYTTILRIRKSGLQPIIAITEEMLSVSADEKDPKTQEDFYNLIEESSRFKALAGFRFKVDINDNIRNLLQEKTNNKESMLELIKKSAKEISYKPSNFDNLQEMEKADKLFEGKVIFVVEGKQIIDEEGAETEIKFKNDEVSNIISW